ncbi:MAG: pentapeptide repeat-containing protein [Clostridiales bacterium]|nr:pentapeptide repeat-containing protein [Clostridiales bacterium]
MNQERKTVSSLRLPDLPASLTQKSPLQDITESALDGQEDVIGVRFADETLQNVEGTGLEFSGCVFERCRFQGNQWKRLCFVDCVLDHCDLSNEFLMQTSFQRVRLDCCRLTGVTLEGATLMNMDIYNCQMDFSAFTETKLNHVMFHDCRLRDSMWDHVTFLHTRLENCDLGQAQWTFTPLAGMDLRGTITSGWMIDPLDLRGAKVSPLQALEFCRLLKLEIMDEEH